MLTGLLTQAALVLLELSEVPEGEGEEFDVEEVDEEETEDGWLDGVELGGTTSSWIEVPEPEVVEGVGGVPGTDVGWAGGVEVVDGGLAAAGDPPPLVMVKVGEMLSALPITKLNAMFSKLRRGITCALTYGKRCTNSRWDTQKERRSSHFPQ